MEGVRDCRSIRFFRAKRLLTRFIYRNMEEREELRTLRCFWWKVFPLLAGVCFFLGLVCLAVYVAVAV